MTLSYRTTTNSNRVQVSVNGVDITGSITNISATTNSYDSGYWDGLRNQYIHSYPVTYQMEFIADTNVNYGTWCAMPAVPEEENNMDVIDALFVLKPKLRKKYGGNREAFRKDLLAAAEHATAVRALDKLDGLLEIEA
jgi:hypothetical protein